MAVIHFDQIFLQKTWVGGATTNEKITVFHGKKFQQQKNPQVLGV